MHFRTHKRVVEALTGQMTNPHSSANTTRKHQHHTPHSARATPIAYRKRQRMTSREEILQRGKTGIAK